MEKTEQYYRLKAAGEYLSEIYDKQIRAELDLRTLEAERIDILGKLAGREQTLMDLWNEQAALLPWQIREKIKLSAQISEHAKGTQELNSALDRNGRLTEEAEKLLSALGIELQTVEQYMIDVGTAADEEFGGVAGAVANMLTDINRRIKNHKLPRLKLEFDVSGIPTVKVGGQNNKYVG